MDHAVNDPLVENMHQAATLQNGDEGTRRQPLIFLFLESDEDAVKRRLVIASKRRNPLSMQNERAAVQLLRESGDDRIVHLII